MRKKLVVVGGGAAGFFCAVNAARMAPGLEVTILEKSSKLLSKVAVSGGGRCNVTHHVTSPAEMLKGYPRGQALLKKAFSQFKPADTIHWFEQRGVELKIESDGRMFPITDSSSTIIQCLLREADLFKVKICMNVSVQSVEKNEKWILKDQHQQIHEADYVCIAIGGLPKLNQYDWLKQLGHGVVDPVPSLFTFHTPKSSLKTLMGVSLPAMVKLRGTKLSITGSVLMTHWGLSGPAILKLSAFAARLLNECDYKAELMINWLPEMNEHQLREQFQENRKNHPNKKVHGKNNLGLPSRLWELGVTECGVEEEITWTHLPAVKMNKMIQWLTQHIVEISGKSTFKEEFVTAGGMDLLQIDSSTMESKLHKGLYFAGEIIDVDGITGGYNFQNAWTTGFVAAKSIAASSTEMNA